MLVPTAASEHDDVDRSLQGPSGNITRVKRLLEGGENDDDYPLARVPVGARYHWAAIATQLIGQTSTLSSFLIGATVGYRLSFWEALLSFTLGLLLLDSCMIMTGLMGQREGLAFSLLARWTGLGQAGAAVLGATSGIGGIGWFGINSELAAEGLMTVFPEVLPKWIWSLTMGLAMTLISTIGMKSMQYVANFAVPTFFILVAYTSIAELSKHSTPDLVSQPAPGPDMSIFAGASLITEGFIGGAIGAPDMMRYNRRACDVVSASLIGLVLGKYVVGCTSVLLAHAVGSADVSTILISSSGWIGMLVILLGTAKINDWALYGAGLAYVNFFDIVFGWDVSRRLVTCVLGILGSFLAAIGILQNLIGFLAILGATFSPVLGIILAEYYVVRVWRPELDRTREASTLPETSPMWVPGSLAIWSVASVFGYVFPFGIRCVNGAVCSFVLEVLLGKLGLIKGYGNAAHTQPTQQDERVGSQRLANVHSGSTGADLEGSDSLLHKSSTAEQAVDVPQT